MSIDPDELSHDRLFVRTAPAGDMSLVEFHDSLNSDDVDIIAKSYSLLKLPLTSADKLKAWELRLLLLLFNNKLSQAKQEAINLNNVLYLLENNNQPPPTQPPQTPTQSPGLTIYPLPRNNHGMIHHRLLVLVLRLKSIPNLGLINEFYKLCYQLRLRSSIDHYDELSKNLINLSFDTLIILTVNRHYLTLLNFLNSIVYEIKSNKLQDYNSLLDNIKLFRIITKILLYESSNTNKLVIIDNIKAEHAQEFTELQQGDSESLEYLVYVLNHIPSHSQSSNMSSPASSSYGTGSTIEITIDQLTLDKVIDLVLTGQITSRILYSTVGAWDLVNSFGFTLDKTLNPRRVEHEEVSVTACLDIVLDQWCNNILKVYGLE